MERRWLCVAAKQKKKPAAKGGRKPAATAAAAAPTIVQIQFQNQPRRQANMSAPKGKDGRTLKGAALAAHQRAHGRKGGGGHKGGHGRKSNPGGGAPAKTNPRGRRRRRNGTTFVQALGKVLGAGAAMFGSGVLVTLGTAKIAPGSPWSMYGIPLAAGALGAGIATRYPLIGAGVAAGGAAPFVLPVASRMLTSGIPSANAPAVSGLRAVAMGSTWRRMAAVRMGAVSMQGRSLHAT